MKKFFILIFASFFVLSGSTSFAHSKTYHHRHSSSSCSGSCVYIIRSEVTQENHKFIDCNKHTLSTQVTTNYYSNGSKRKYLNHTVLNSDGSILLSDCSDVEHIVFNNKHYFYYKKGKYYTIIDDKLNILNARNYTKMSLISPNKLLVVFNKNYGVIDLFEHDIIPIKYKSFEKVGLNLYKTKLNGYYGLLNDSNNIILKNEYDKITHLYDTFILKKCRKYGLTDKNGYLILDTKYDKIKNLGEYIIAKKDKMYEIFDLTGKKITSQKYKKIKLERNKLEGLKTNNNWEEIK